jgi:hypothetical protein
LSTWRRFSSTCRMFQSYSLSFSSLSSFIGFVLFDRTANNRIQPMRVTSPVRFRGSRHLPRMADAERWAARVTLSVYQGARFVLARSTTRCRSSVLRVGVSGHSLYESAGRAAQQRAGGNVGWTVSFYRYGFLVS